MPDPKFAKPWHGIPREQIDWRPTVNEAACIGCGTCITGCGRLVYPKRALAALEQREKMPS